MTLMKAAQVSYPGGKFELVEREIPNPGRGQVRIKVEACGICHSDSAVKEGYVPGLSYPRIPGHEIAGYIDAVGEDVTSWKEGQRVGVGWNAGHCLECEACRRGDFVNCEKALTCGISYDGGYAEYMVAPQEALALIPEQLTSVEAAPLLCAGITTFNALRNSGARAGDVVAIQGIGGLGHLAIQFANKMGFKTVALSRGQDKETLAKEFGAHTYIDTSVQEIGEALGKLGAKIILATAPNSKAISGLVDGLGDNGKLLIVAATGEPVEVNPAVLLAGRKSVQGWNSGTSIDSEDTLNFSVQTGTRPMIETFSLEQVNEAYEKMMNGQTRFRAVIKF
ncbi:D-arabinose 1-dehydrogenase-like Zn-dependent alcohol dehydrogenase [Pullulanibacillus pueri]|uniref:Alcohol dehydrogenase n=1 Tax=Pullulanibacillus pueri TaxID=1437324 RepID=A0A8J2ZVY8_9BACL|nr:alcohol dehydrogenase [Pullulanibacillus pueri]MBM7682630.1 D-arabinose 1-dehydrogenase-like Zn-dependent alcohol dehydrogenase [Pullulanibacillus pueri]GGH82577.1 alcohol dehydrogenase [Pullulanibacillus pueri]